MMQALCRERDGNFMREIIPLQRSPRVIAHVMECMSRVPNFLTKVNPEGVFKNQYNSFYTVDDVGIIAVVNPNLASAHAHITFWDRVLHGREQLCTKVAIMHLEATRLRALWTVIPEDRDIVIAFAERVGFRTLSHSDGHRVLIYRRGNDGA